MQRDKLQRPVLPLSQFRNWSAYHTNCGQAPSEKKYMADRRSWSKCFKLAKDHVVTHQTGLFAAIDENESSLAPMTTYSLCFSHEIITNGSSRPRKSKISSIQFYISCCIFTVREKENQFRIAACSYHIIASFFQLDWPCQAILECVGWHQSASPTMPSDALRLVSWSNEACISPCRWTWQEVKLHRVLLV